MVNFGTNKENFRTMLQQKNDTKNMQTHIEKVYAFLALHLPYSYADDVIMEMEKKELPIPSKATIRKVRSRASKSHEKRTDILNAMVDIAKRYKAEKEALSRKIPA